MGYAWSMLQALFIMGIMLAVLYAVMKKVKTKQFAKSSQHSLMQIVDGMNIGMNQQMYLVKVGDEYLVATFGSQGVQMVKLEQTTFRDPKESFESYFEQDKPSYLLKDTAKKIKGRLMKDAQE